MSERQEAKELVDLITELIEKMAPGLAKELLYPQEIQVTSFRNGKGVGLVNGKVIDLASHPLQSLNSGDVAVAVPISPSKFYVVGKVA